jgi:hypothetical protein
MNQAFTQRNTTNLALLKMYMVYRAMRDGWRVSRLSSDKFMFIKRLQNPEKYSAQTFLKDFLL